MKIIFTVFFSLTLLACSNGLENKAKTQLKKTMKELLKNPETAQLTNLKTVHNNDSICILQFNCKAQNGFGGFNTSKYEYVLIRGNKEGQKNQFTEMLVNLDERPSVIEDAHETDEKLVEEYIKAGKKIPERTEEERITDSIRSIYYQAAIRAIFIGRDVVEDEGESIKLN